MTDKSAEHLQQQIDSANSYIEELQTKVAFQEHTIEALTMRCLRNKSSLTI